MRLSELFLKIVNKEKSAETVRKALHDCNQKMIKTMGSFEDESELETLFLM